MTITGTIEDIEYRNTDGHEKKVVTLISDYSKRSFVEFRGFFMDELTPYKKNDFVCVGIYIDGKVSKNSGIQYNNIVAISIEKVT